MVFRSRGKSFNYVRYSEFFATWQGFIEKFIEYIGHCNKQFDCLAFESPLHYSRPIDYAVVRIKQGEHAASTRLESL